jgi:hypothetical protein
MSGSQKLLIVGGLILATAGMLYGLHYAVFVEHQTLDRMGGSLASAFVEAADRQMPEASRSISAYAATKYDYVRQVDVHSHWIGLAMLMIVLGAAFKSVGFSERGRFWLAMTLVSGSFIFPLGVILQTVSHGGVVPSSLAILGSAMVTVALAGVAWGFAREA